MVLDLQILRLQSITKKDCTYEIVWRKMSHSVFSVPTSGINFLKDVRGHGSLVEERIIIFQHHNKVNIRRHTTFDPTCDGHLFAFWFFLGVPTKVLNM